MLSDLPLRLNPDVLFRTVGHEGVIIDQRSANVLVVNLVALKVLEMIREQIAPVNMVDIMCNEFEVAPDQAADDLVQFLDVLDQRAMLD